MDLVHARPARRSELRVPAAVGEGRGLIARRADRAQYAEWSAIGVLVVAFVVAAVRALGQRWLPASDEALMELLISDVPRDLPLTGVYSRLGYDHPGPAQLILLAVPYRLLGSASAALSAATLVLHLAGLVLAWWMARRLDRVTAMIVVVGLQLVVLSVDPTDLRMIWNPYVAIVVSGTLVIAAWSAAERRTVGAVALLPIGSLLVQAHGGAAPTVAVVSLAALGAALGTHRRPTHDTVDQPTFPWRPWAAGAGLALLMWVPPLVDQFTGTGNLGRILDGSSSGDPSVGWQRAAAAIAQSWSVRPVWTRVGGGVGGLSPESIHLPVLVIVAVLGLGLALRRRDATMVRGLALAAVANLAALVGIAILPAPPFQYLFIGTRALAATTVAIALGSVLRSVSHVIRPAAATIAAAGISVALSLVLVSTQWSADVPTPTYQTAVAELTAGIDDDIEARGLTGPVEISAQGGTVPLATYTGVRLQIERGGTTAADGGSWTFPDGPPAPTDGRPQYSVVTPEVAADLATSGWTIVAEQQPFTAAERAELDDLERRLAEADAAQDRRAADSIRSRIDELTDGRVAVAAVRRDDRTATG